MASIISFFKWLLDLFASALKYISEGPGKVVAFITTFVSTIVSSVAVISTNIASLASFFTSSSAKVAPVVSAVNRHPAGSLLVHVLSLDVAFDLFSSALGIVLALSGVIVLTFFSWAIVAWLVPLALKLVLKVISFLSGGFVSV